MFSLLSCREHDRLSPLLMVSRQPAQFIQNPPFPGKMATPINNIINSQQPGGS